MHGCNLKNENPLLGKWESDDQIRKILRANYKVAHLEFGLNFMKIDEKEIPVIYKIKKKQVVLFSRGEKVVVNILSEDKIVLYLKNIGKRIYIRNS